MAEKDGFKQCCKNCRFFKDGSDEDSIYRYSCCRRYPENTSLKTELVIENHWCGEWKSKEEGLSS